MPKSHFKELNRSKIGGRSGILNTRAGRVLTPFFMPVATRGAVVGLEPAKVAATGAQILLANTYHLHLQPGEKVIKNLGSLHSFTGWQGPMLTDSGGFQVFSLANVRKITEEGVQFKDPKTGDEVLMTPEKSMQIQLDLGADIIMAFDDLTGLDPAKAKVREAEAVERTHRWLLRCITEYNRLTNLQGRSLQKYNKPLLFGIVQGGLSQELRAKSLQFVQSTPVDGIAIGGLSVGESRKDMHAMLDFLSPLLDPARVHYLMGVGDPADMRHAIKRGIDMFDCVLPTRNGRHGSVWVTGDRRLNLNNGKFAKDPGPIDKKCDCHTCRTGYSRAFMRQLFKTGNSLGGSLASIHNLRYLSRICENYQDSVSS
jgi:queuine tRNA-ribosyltransferase